MPLYEYQCDECGLRFERRQSFNDAPIAVCPECEGSVHRVIGTTGVIFKGSGFYVTDNRKSNSANRSSSKSGESSTENKSDSGSELKAESTPEAKSEAKPASATV